MYTLISRFDIRTPYHDALKAHRGVALHPRAEAESNPVDKISDLLTTKNNCPVSCTCPTYKGNIKLPFYLRADLVRNICY